MSAVHVPVLLQEVLENLRPLAGATLLDGTLGLGGHALAWLARTAEEGAVGQVVGCDRDPAALEIARERIEDAHPGRLHAHHGSYEEAPAALAGAGLAAVDAALLDLGVSSLQLDDAERGFSFQAPGPLDMRMDPAPGGRTAADLVNEASRPEIESILAELGEEPQAARIAHAIVTERRHAPFRDTLRLAECIANATGGRRGRLHPATRSFQGLRIAVNDELGRLERGLPAVSGCVRAGGRLGVITFHRLEDRPVKRFLRDGVRDGRFRALPDHTPSARERGRNPRSRSARLRCVEVVVEPSPREESHG